MRPITVGAALGAFLALYQGLDTPASLEGVSFIVGEMIVSAAFGAWICKTIMARFSEPGR
jgi:hypothetical protein